MFGIKLRSWMEAVRPRKKQQRKEKQHKSNVITMGAAIGQNSPNYHNSQTPKKVYLEKTTIQSMSCNSSHTPRCSGGANLSSPESAYSTGYSTDGTSPGVPPPEYYINIKTASHKFNETNFNGNNRHMLTCLNEISPRPIRTPRLNAPNRNRNSLSPKNGDKEVTMEHSSSNTTTPLNTDQMNVSTHANVIVHNSFNSTAATPLMPRLGEVVVNSALTSPRQRNRIRTNPWVPSGSTLSPANSNAVLQQLVRHQQEQIKQTSTTLHNNNSPMRNRYVSNNFSSPLHNKKVQRYSNCSLSSSSCSSLSATSLHWDSNLLRQPHHSPCQSDEEDDCTLNEMMGKYDESYVYEKETDILSDSDPTDCETDIDTGQDGGDEEEPLEQEFDFIDNGSYLECNEGFDERNTGHCTYHNFEVQKRMSRRRNVVRRSHKQNICNKQVSEKRKRSSTSKKKQMKHNENTNKYYPQMMPPTQVDGCSKSAGATPVSVRRIKQQPISKLALEYQLKKRSNSVSFCGDAHNVSAFDKRDKEADKKYKELIVEAERILMTMNNNNNNNSNNNSSGFSPRRVPGPANKRVELLRSAESAKTDFYTKSRIIEEQLANIHLTRIPSNQFSSPRFSPKKNHITNFINNNSPVLIRREFENAPRPVTPLLLQKQLPIKNAKVISRTDQIRRSPKYKKKLSRTSSSKKNENYYSSDSDDDENATKTILRNKNVYLNEFDCPQSEPVKRKVYTNQKQVYQFGVNCESSTNIEAPQKSDVLNEDHKGSEKNLRHQVLLNTIVNLKRSLEDQSASLQQVYKSSQELQEL